MTTIDELAKQYADMADALDALAAKVAASETAQRYAALEARLSPSDPLRVGAYPAGADVYPAGSTTPGQENILADGSVTAGAIAPGAITTPSFASTIRPITLVTALPTLPDTLYPQGSFVYKTNDSPPRLYKNVADAWVAAIGPNDIQADSITAGQIAAGAISASEIAAGAVSADKIAVGFSQNLVANPSFESFLGTLGADLSTSALIQAALPGWTDVTHPSGSQIFVGSGGVAGSRMLWAVTPGTPATVAAYSNYIPVEPGRRYGARAFTCGHAGNSAGATGKTYIFWYDASLAFLSSSAVGSSVVGASTAFVEQLARVTAPASAAFGRFLAYNPSTNTAGDYIGFDMFELYEASLSSSVSLDGTGVTVTNGAITVSNAGATVIIDGTSNMFKIQASGTSSVTVANDASGGTTVTLTALGTMSATPGHISYVSLGSTDADPKYVGWAHEWMSGATFVALTSGGSPTQSSVAARSMWGTRTTLDGSSYAVHVLNGTNGSGASRTVYCRYYVLKEVAI